MAATRTVFIDTALSNYASLAARYDASVFDIILLNPASSGIEQIRSWLANHSLSPENINIVSSSHGVNGMVTPRVVFIDPNVADLDAVIAGMPGNATVVVLDANRDGVQQMHDYLAANAGTVAAIDIISGIASVDVVSHGSPGEIMLGTTVLNADTLAGYGSQLAAIGSLLSANADLLLYGCDVASGPIGEQFIAALAAATGADVAASNDLTGSAAAGGNWVLEAHIGTIETAALNIANYNGLLDSATSIGTITLSNDTGISATDFVTNSARQTITGSFTATGNGNTVPEIYVSTGGPNSPRTLATISGYPDPTKTANGATISASFSVTVDLVPGADGSIQFWTSPTGMGSQVPGSAKGYTLDTTKPSTGVATLALSRDSGASGSDFITDTAAQTISGTLGANTVQGEVVRISLDNGLTWQTAANTVGTKTFSLSNVTLPGGGTIKVQVEDTAGNAGAAYSQAFVVDTVAPQAGVLSLGDLVDSGTMGDRITNDRSFVLALAGNEAGANVIYEASFQQGGFAPTTASQANLADGSYLFRARVTDLAGNTTTTNTIGVTIDATAPGAPVITGFSDNSGAGADTTTMDKTPTLTMSAEANAIVEVYRDGVLVGTASQTASNSGTYTFESAALPDGSYTFTAKALDAAGNASPVSHSQNITIDTTLSTPTAVLATDSGTGGDGLTNSAVVNFNSVDADAKRVIMVDNTQVDNYDPAALGDGKHTVKVTDTDAAGNVRSTSLEFVLDTTLSTPTAVLATDSGTGGDGLTNSAVVNFNSPDADAKRVIVVDNKQVDNYDPAVLGDGKHTVKVTDTDAAGNVRSTSLEFVLDTTLSTPTAVLATDSGTGGDGLTNSAVVNFNSPDADAKRVIVVDNKQVDNYDPAALGDGKHTVKVTDTDAAGNVRSTSLEFVLDTTLSTPTAVLATDSGAGGDGLTNSAAVNFSTPDADAKRVILVDGDKVDNYDPAKLGDGKHTVKVTDTDAAGNVRSTSLEFVLDTTLSTPTAVLATDSGTGGDGLTNSAAVNFSTPDADAKRVILVDGDKVDNYDPAKLGDGKHAVKVTDTDAAGNVRSTSLEFVLDTTLSTPTAVLATDSGTGGDGLTNSAVVNFNSVDADAKRVIMVDNTQVDNYDPAALGDGKHTVKVTDTDAAGNVRSTSLEFVLDTTLSTPTAVLATDSGAGGDGLTNSAVVNFNSPDADAKRVIVVDNTQVDNYDPAALGDGKHTVKVTDTDAAGNVRSTSLEFVLDTTLSTPTAVLATDSGAGGDGLTNSAVVNFNSPDADAKRVIVVDNKQVDNYDPAVLGDGKHTVKVTDTDAAGNVRSTSLEFVLDTTLSTPTAVLATDSGAGGDGLTNSAVVNFNSPDADAKRVIVVDNKQVDNYDPAVLGDGKHTVKVTDTDAAGNVRSTSLEFVLDTTLSTPTAVLATDSGTGGDGLTNSAAVNFNSPDADAKRVIVVDNKQVDNYDPAVLGDGKHTVKVTDTDAAGNVRSTSLEFVLDTTLSTPTAVLATDSGAGGDGLTNSAAVNFSTPDADAKRVILVDGDKVDNYDPAKLGDGKHTVKVTDTDAAGNVRSTSLEFVLDTTLSTPTAVLATDSGTGGDGLTNSAAVNFSTPDADAKRVILVDGDKVDNYDPAKLGDGKHAVKVTDTDAAGNVRSTSLEFVLDTTLSTPTAVLATDSGTGGDGLTNSAVVNFNSPDADAKRVIVVDNKQVDNYDPAALGDGKHTVKVTDTDAAGNVRSTSLEFVLDTTLSTPIAVLATDSGAGGDGLTNSAVVNFNSPDADAKRVIVVDNTQVDKYDPAKLADGTHTVKVTDTDAAGNVRSSSLAFTLDTTLSTPTALLATDSGVAGDGLTNSAAVNFNSPDADAKRVIVVDGTQVDKYDPAKLADGVHTVKVTDTDAAGNVRSASLAFRLDTTLSTPTIALATDSGTAGDGLTNSAALSFNDPDADATRVITVDGNKVDKYDPAQLADGEHSVKVTDTDAAGNVRIASLAFRLDNTGPLFTSPAQASIAENVGERQLVYRAIATDQHAVVYSLAGVDAAKFELRDDGRVILLENPNYELRNAYSFTLAAVDAAGNRSEQKVALGIANVNEAPDKVTLNLTTIENAAINVQLAEAVSDQDIGDKHTLSLDSNMAKLSWVTNGEEAPKLINPVTKAAVDLNLLSVKATLSADGTGILITSPSELDWMLSGQTLKASFEYTVTDMGGLSSRNVLNIIIKGSTNDAGENLQGGNGNDILSGSASRNAEDVLQGGNGNDVLSGYGGTDALYGGSGDDKLYGGAGIDYLYGDSGNDLLDGGTEGDFLFGGKGNDILIGGTGADKFVFESQNGNDRILDFNISEGDKLFFAGFFATPITFEAFLAKYVTDIGDDLLISLHGTSVVLVGIANAEQLKGAIEFAMPS